MIDKLVKNIQKTNAPIVVGLDPMLNYVPEHIQKAAFAEYGETLEGAGEAIWQFNKGIVDACDEGFTVVNHESGNKRDFFLTRVNEQEGDLVSLEFQTSDGKLTILIFND
jgi:hypothetical protein